MTFRELFRRQELPQADAERLKERYGCAYEPMVDPSEVITLPSTVAQGDRQIPRELLAHIIHQRTDEIFDLVMRDVEAAGYAGKLSAGVVLTGGAAAIPGITELAANSFRVTQTAERLRRYPVEGVKQAENVARDVGAEVRSMMMSEGGTAPEDLPLEEHIGTGKKVLKTASRQMAKLDKGEGRGGRPA